MIDPDLFGYLADPQGSLGLFECLKRASDCGRTSVRTTARVMPGTSAPESLILWLGLAVTVTVLVVMHLVGKVPPPPSKAVKRLCNRSYGDVV